MPRLNTVDLVVLLTYVVGVVALGCWFARRNKSADDFMTAGRSLAGWVVGLSVFGTFLSSNTFLGVPGKAFGSNWSAFVFSLSLPIGTIVAVRWFVPFFRETGEISAYHHLERRFGAWARTYAVACQLLTQLARVGTIMYGVALALEALLGWDIAAIIIATGVLVTLYTLLGGIAAVIWTDVVQAIVLSVGAVIAAAVLVGTIPGGPSQLFEIARAEDKFGLGGFGPDLSQETFWVVLVYGIFINLVNFGVDQNYVQRYHAAKSGREATKSLWLGSLSYIPVAALFFFIGTALFAFYEAQPELQRELRTTVAERALAEDGIASDSPGYASRLEQRAETLGTKDIADRAFPHFIANHLPAGLAGLLIAALFAAAMSSVDSSLNSSATVFVTDVYRRYFSRELDDRGTLRALQVTTVVFGAGGTAAGVAMIGADSILQAWWELQGVFAGGMLGLFLLGLISRRARNAAAVTGVTIGVLVIALLTAAQSRRFEASLGFLKDYLHANLTIVIGTLTIFLVGVIVSRLAGGKPGDEPSSIDSSST